MQQKLTSMRQVLKGIVTEDFALIQANAKKMRTLGTDTDWNVIQGPIYGNYLASYRRSADLLTTAAKSKNADGAMLVYMQMTLNCIECHKYTRDPKVKRTPRVQ